MTALRRLLNIDDVRVAARRALPRVVFDYVDGGADDEHTIARNRDAFAALTLRPRAGIAVGDPDLATTVLGQPVSMPVLLAPCGQIRLVHPRGDLAAAGAAADAGSVAVLSTMSGHTIEEVAGVPGPKWFQLYFLGGVPGARALMERARTAGFGALVVTMDTPTGGNRERDVRNGYRSGLQVDLRGALTMGPRLMRKPRWLRDFVRDGMSFDVANLAGLAESGVDPSSARAQLFATPPTWDDLAWVREAWGSAPLVVKGILTAEDARRAVDAGADAVIVSNHGGRQLDGAVATIEALGEVVDAVAGSVEVLLDGGVRRGTDVIKAIALGARAVLIGRPYCYGLAVAGRAGVEHVLDLLRSELDRDMRLLGCASIADLDRTYVR